MLTTRWDQGTPYRNLCPLIDGNPATTGCVATAMAQIMNFWKYPEILPSLPGYTTSTHSIQVPALPPISAEWNLMQESYKEGSYTQDQAIAVATLMRYCGQSAKTDYTIANSGAWLHDQLDGFKRFGYSDNATCIWRSNYTESLWNDLILDDLDLDLIDNVRGVFLTDILGNMTCESLVMKFADARRAVLIIPSEEETESERSEER
ncbi:C10 family peptidase, partial [uncultured Methanobrevibacter sp.]|uniref:C10 family peptidase n=1 Tax=uncultured Methanobrevibacter sp. TaxID=253161 RepID=UPI00260BBAA1